MTTLAAAPPPAVLVAEDETPVPQRSGTTADEHRTALRFVLGRPGWRVEARSTERGETYLGLTTPCRDTGDQRFWRLVRTPEGLVICDDASGQRLWAGPTMREALVEVWEATTDAAHVKG